MKPFNPRPAALCLASALFVICAAASAVTAQTRPGRITALKVSTLESSEGELSLSEDLFKGKPGNKPVFAGTGAANYPEHYLLVLVEVTGNTSGKVELRATEGRRLVWRNVANSFYQKLGADTEDINNPRTYAIFFIEGERCVLLKLTARYIGPGKSSSMTRTVEFDCGE